jgi:hypothetical protein
MEKAFNPLKGGSERFRAKIDASIQKQKSERTFLVGATGVLAFGIVLATIVPKMPNFLERQNAQAPKKSELVLVTSQPGAKVFWVF